MLTYKEWLAMMSYIAEKRSFKFAIFFSSIGAIMNNDDVVKYNNRMYYGFLTFFTVVAGLFAYMVS